MATNISKYVQINDFLLLEYEFNKDKETTILSDAVVVESLLGTKTFYEGNNAIGITNNTLQLNSVPTNVQRTSWYLDVSTPENTYEQFWSMLLFKYPVHIFVIQ